MIRIGVVGSNYWNGHPYSYSALINGYDPSLIETCPYPIIRDYISCVPPGGCAEFKKYSVTRLIDTDFEYATKVSKFALINQISVPPPMNLSDLDYIFFLRDDFGSADYVATLSRLVRGLEGSNIKRVFFDKGCPYRKRFGLLDYEKFASLYPTSFSHMRQDLSNLISSSMSLGSSLHLEAVIPRQFLEYGAHIVSPISDYLTDHEVQQLWRALVDEEQSSAIVDCAWGFLTVSCEKSLTESHPVGFRLVESSTRFEAQVREIIPWNDYVSSFRSMLDVNLTSYGVPSLWDKLLMGYKC